MSDWLGRNHGSREDEHLDQGGEHTSSTSGAAGSGAKEIEAVLDEFLSAETWLEARHVLETHHSVLLSQRALASLRTRVASAQDMERAFLEQHLRLLEDAQVHGVAAAWQAWEEARKQRLRDTLGALDAFVGARSWEGKHEVLLKRQDVLLTEIVIALLRRKIEETRSKGDMRAALYLLLHYQILADALEAGIESAWQHFLNSVAEASSKETELGLKEHTGQVEPQDPARNSREYESDKTSETVQGDIVQSDSSHPASDASHQDGTNPVTLELTPHIPERWQRIFVTVNRLPSPLERNAALNEVLKRLNRDAEPLVWAVAHMERGFACSDISDVRPQYVEQAISDYDAALRVLNAESLPRTWALVLHERSSAYIKRLQGDRAKNIEQAIADCDAALTVRHRDSDPTSWAETISNRGAAYSLRINGDRAQNIEQAIADFDAALTVQTREVFPSAWASTLANRGAIYPDRIKGSRRRNLEQALTDLSAVLTVRTREESPIEWATVLRNRGTVYLERIDGAPNENIQRAIADFNEALTVFTPESVPYEWARTRRDRGTAYRMDQIGDRLQNVEQAIADFDAALSVLTRNEAPADWAVTMQNQGIAYMERVAGVRAQNLERAIANFDAALTVNTRSASPRDWAGVLTNRGNAYGARILGDRVQNVEQAIADFDAALTVRTREAFPQSWAHVLLLRGAIYPSRLVGDHGENIERAIADFNAALTIFTSESHPEYWATTRQNRGNAYLGRIIGDRRQNIERAIEDFTAALSVLSPEQQPDLWSAALQNRGIAYRRRLRGDRAANIEQAIADFNAALTVRTRTARPKDWAHTLTNRGNAYTERLVEDHAENIERAIADFDAALSVSTPETAPWEWAETIQNRGIAYMGRIRGDRAQNLERALADLDAALTVRMRERMPREYCETQLNRAAALSAAKRWLDAHEAFREARDVMRDEVANAIADTVQSGVIADRANLNVYARDAWALLQLNVPDAVAAACALEDGRAQSLRAALALTDLDPAHIDDPAARGRAETYLAARERWRDAQRLWISPFLAGIEIGEIIRQQNARAQALHDAYSAFVGARNAIRQADNPDFGELEPTLADLARPLTSPGDALLYLAATADGGFALLVSQPEPGRPHVEHMILPALTEGAVADLLQNHAPLDAQATGEPGEAPGRQTICGGLLQGQLGWAYGYLDEWGTSLQLALESLPPTSGFAKAIQLLAEEWRDNPELRQLLFRDFSGLSQKERMTLEHAFNRLLLRVELRRSLDALGVLGLNEVAARLRIRHVRRLALVPYGPLSIFAFPAVIVTDSQISDSESGRTATESRRLGDIFEISIVPSARALAMARQHAGQMDLSERPFILAVGDPSPLPANAPGLHYAQAEAEATRRIASALHYSPRAIQCLTRKLATKSRVVSALQEAWFAQLAMHAVYRQEAPRRSMLILAGEDSVPASERTITLDECLAGDIKLVGLRLLVLSACETSIIDVERAPNEVLGLATGFLQAGAAGVIATLWPVDDRATYLLMSRFTQLYLDPQQKRSPASALAEAQRWLREEASYRVLATYDPTVINNGPSVARSMRYSQATVLELLHVQVGSASELDALPYADPIYWAAFVVTGC
jgi:tetratricopeptide (TPR) repeat protein